ncbi:MAG TPA: transposase [Isosphaeraceae bacterium]|nr:transposase [Isosphaeraceae bacterium]
MASIADRPRRRLSQKQLREQLRAVRRQKARKARAARRQIGRIHQQLPEPVRSIFDPLAPAFTRPTHHRFLLLALAAILTVGRHTVANLLRCLGALAPGHPSSYHRVFSRDRWSSWALARRFAQRVLARFVPRGPIALAGDDTVEEHPGAHVYGKGCHRDPVRSTASFTAYRWGHKWVVLAVLVRVPFATRRWALPLVVALYRPEDEDRKQGRRHKTPPQLVRQMLRVLMRWFPERTFVATGDGNYATHELAELAARYPQRLTFVSKFYPDANPVAPPPEYSGLGRPRVKGGDLPDPAAVVREAPTRPSLEVAWYGGGRRRVEVVTGTGLWYKGGRLLVPVRWVFVHDLTGTHRDEYFFTTAVAMTPTAVIETYTGRWNIETTFQEMRSYVGLETTRGWSRNTVLRVAPCLFGLYTVVAWLYAELPARWARVRVIAWPGKHDVTFSDAITAVRRWLWVEWVFALPGHREAFSKLSGPSRQILLNGLAPAS